MAGMKFKLSILNLYAMTSANPKIVLGVFKVGCF